MINTKSKLTATLIAAILICSIGASTFLISTANAHTPSWSVPTFAYIQVVPNPIGVGQTATVYMWLSNTFDNTNLYNNYRFHNYELTITGPDGKTIVSQTFAVVSDPTSNQQYPFTPTVAGTYTANFTFPGQAITTSDDLASSAYINDTYAASSATCTFTVQQTPISYYPTTPLPTNYWTRPIYGENTNWYTISSNWLGTGSAGYGTGAGGCSVPPGNAVGPVTSHVMWTYPIQMGGVAGGGTFTTTGATYFDGSAYNGRFTNPIVVDGYLYYTLPVSFTGSANGPTVCQDLRTGQILWSSTQIPSLSFAYVQYLYDPNQHGIYPPILFTSNFARAYDAYTGDPLFNVTGVPTGTAMPGPQGEQLKLILSNLGTAGNHIMYLSEWNSSRIWDCTYNPWTGAVNNVPTLYNDSTASGTALTTAQTQYATVTEPVIGAVDGNNPNAPAMYNYVVYANVVNNASSLYSYDWNYSLSWLNSVIPTPTIVAAWSGNMAILVSGTMPSATSWTPYTYYGLNLNASVGPIGEELWSNTITAPAGNITVSYSGPANGDPTYGVFVEFHKETMQFVGYSMATGKQIWGPVGDQSQQQLMYYNSGYNSGGNEAGAAEAYGKLYYCGFGGIMSCYNLATGNLLWTYGNGGVGNSTNSGFERPGYYPTSIYAIGNGVIYTSTTEHTVSSPIYKGALQRAINATNGKEIWTLNDVTSEAGSPAGNQEVGVIADGFSLTLNGYDNQIYCVGQGSSATTVTATHDGLSFGQSVVISGTVMDTSAGTKQNEQVADFPNGVPCASDASMSQWMSYVYQQQAAPTNFTGVPVNLYVLDSNHNYRSIGTATTDKTGFYTLTWTPDISGNYTVYATFAGNAGYWSSSDETSFTVSNPVTTPAPTASPVSNLATMSGLTLGFVAVAIAIIIAIAVVGLLLLRKKP